MTAIIEAGDLVEFDVMVLPPADPMALDNTPVNVEAVRKTLRGRVTSVHSSHITVRTMRGFQYALRSYRKVLPP